MSEYKVISQLPSWFSKHSGIIMIGCAFFTGLVVATIITVPTTLALSRQGKPSKGMVTLNYAIEPDVQLHVGAFNIKSYGEAKSQNDFVFNHVVEILSRYDVILVQEVRDKCGNSLRKLWQGLNETGSPFGFVHSERLGRTSYTEQYVFFYRLRKAELMGTQQYDDSRDDDFEREPFTAEFSYYSVQDKMKKRVALMALHTKPKKASTELEKLPDVMRLTLRNFKHSDGIIALGDFNADCAYLSKKKKNSMELFRKGGHFSSLLNDSADTTVSSTTDCAYDRAVVYGRDVKVSKARVFNFQAVFGLDENEAKKISDHYPIEFDLL